MRSILDPVLLILRSEIDCVSVRNCSPRYNTNGKFYSHEGINKKWRDEVYGLVNGHWQYMGKMKQPLGYGVSVSYGDEVFLIGGENAKGKPVSSVTSFTMRDGNLLIK